MIFLRKILLLVATLTFNPLISASPSFPPCKNPIVRKEWRELSKSDQKAFISAVKCLGKLPHDPNVKPDGSEPDVPPIDPKSNRYDDFVYAHYDGVIRNHATGVFLSWHRWFLHTLEDSLRKECGYKGGLPYWDWSRDVASIPDAPVFSSDPETGFGKLSMNAADNFTLHDGAFSNVVRAYPTPHVIGRTWIPQPFQKQFFPFPFNLPNKYAVESLKPSEIDYIVSHFQGNYTGFQGYMDGIRAEGMHTTAHIMLGGDVGNIAYSPNDPLFFFHHGNLDRIWATWQAYDPRNARAFGGGRTQNFTFYDEWPTGSPPLINTSEMLHTSGLTAYEPKVADVLSTTGGYLCYKY